MKVKSKTAKVKSIKPTRPSVLVWVRGGTVQSVEIATASSKEYEWADKKAPVNVVIADMDVYDDGDADDMKRTSDYLREEAKALPKPLRSRLLAEVDEEEAKIKMLEERDAEERDERRQERR